MGRGGKRKTKRKFGKWPILVLSSIIVVVGMYFAVFPHSAFAINSILFNDQTEFDFDYDQKLFEQHFLDNYGNIPLSFEINDGQTDERVEFLSRGNDYTIYLTSNDVVLSFTKLIQQDGENKNSNVKFINDVVGIELVGSNQESQISGLQQISTKSNYFIGNDPDNWQKDISHFSKVLYKEIYPGTDLVFYGNQQQLEFDFVVYPGADPDNIKLDFKGVEKLSLDSSGNLILHVSDKKVVLKAPIVYQEINGIKKIILGHYEITDGKKVGFVLGDYDHNNILIIDPVLVYSTYLGGSSTDSGLGIAVDSSGNAYVIGRTDSIDFPTVNPFQPTKGGNIFNNDVFVAKLNAAGNALIYSTYLGGNSGDNAGDITVDLAGNAYLIGDTFSTDFPTFNPIQPSLIGSGGISDIFVTKLNAAGNGLVYSTYLGGTGGDQGKGITIDLQGNVYLTGVAGSNFPTTLGVIKPFGGNDAIVTKINPSGSMLVYSTYLGGTKFDFGHDIAVDSSGNAYIVGNTGSINFPTTSGAFQTSSGTKGDAFVSKLNPTATALVYSTYLGGSSTDNGLGIAVDSSRNAYVVGNTLSANFPTVNPIQTDLGFGFDGFVAKLNPAGSALVYSTYLSGGAPAFNSANDVAVDSSGNAYVVGEVASSINFPTANAIQSIGGGSDDAFVAKLNPAGNAIYSTFLGGSSVDHGNGIALDASGSAYITGQTCSTNFPLANPIQSIKNGGCDAFVAKIGAPPPPPSTSEIEHYLSYKVKQPKGDDKFEKLTVELSDPFEIEPTTYTVEKPDRLFNPVDKNGEGLIDVISHYVGYKIKTPKGDDKFEHIKGVSITDQFGQLTIDIKKPKLLLVPSLKDHDQVPVPLISFAVDHFKCYDVKETKDTPKFDKRTVDLLDQFAVEPFTMEVKKPKMLCVPVHKTHEGVTSEINGEENNLTCYDVKKLKGADKFEKRNVFTNNQFGPEELKVEKQEELCVPSNILE